MDNEAFFKMPKVLFTDKYKGLSAEAKLLYFNARQDTVIRNKRIV